MGFPVAWAEAVAVLAAGNVYVWFLNWRRKKREGHNKMGIGRYINKEEGDRSKE